MPEASGSRKEKALATRTISTKLAVEGEFQYKQAISSINAELGNLNSRLKLVKSEFQNHQNSMEALQAKSEALAEVQKAQSQKVDTLKSAYANAQTALDSYKQKTESLKSSLEQNKNALSSLDSETQKAGKEWAGYAEQAAAAEKKLEELQNTTGDTSEEEENLQKELADAKAAMAQLEEETGGAAKTAGELLLEQQNLTSELDKAEAGQEAAAKACNNWQKQLNTAQIQLNNTNAEIELNDKYLQEASVSADGCAKSIDEFGKQAKEAGEESKDSLGELSALIASAGIAEGIKEITQELYDCAVAAGEFHAQMSTVEAISGATSAEISDLTALAKQMGATTKFTANQAGEAMEYMAMAGWDAAKMMDGLAGIMNLAAASGEDLGTTSDIVTDALTAFKMEASESGQFADILAQTSASANTNVSLLGESFKYVAPLCGTLGYSAEDASIALGLMANAGIKGSQAGTALKTSLANLSAPTDRQSAMMDKLGISLQGSGDTMKSLRELMLDLRGSFGELSAVEQTAAASTIFGKEAMSGMLNIINASDEDFNKLVDSIDNCSGAAERMAAIQLDNYAGQITLLESATEGLSIAIGEVLTPSLGILAEEAAGAASVATEFIGEHPAVVAAITGVAAALGILAAGITVMTVVQLPALSAAIGAVTAAVADNPIGLLVTAVVAGGAAIATATGIFSAHEAESRELEKATKSLTEQIQEQEEAYGSICEENESLAENNMDLAKSLDELLKSSDKSAAKQERIKYLVDQLNESVPELALNYDEESSSINMTTEELEKYLEAAGQQSAYEADVERMNELYSEQAQIQAQLEEAQRQLFEAQDERQQALETYGEEFYRVSEEYQNAAEKAEEAQSAIDELTAIQEENTTQLSEAEEAVNSYAASMGEGMSGAAESAEEASAQMVEDLDALGEAYDEAYDSAYESVTGQNKLWQKVDGTVAMTSEDIQSAIKSQISYWEDYADNLDNLMDRNIDGLDAFVSSVNDGSSNAAAYIAGMADMSDEELSNLIDSYADLVDTQNDVVKDTAEMKTGYTEAMESMVSSTEESVEGLDLAEKAETAGTNTMEGYTAGLSGKQTDVDTMMETIADSAQEKFCGKMGIHSPSTVYRGFGVDTMQGYIDGVDEKNGSLLEKMGEMAQSAIAKFFGISNGSSLKTSGSDTITGYITGLSSKDGTMLSKMSGMALSAVKKFAGNATKSSLSGSGSDTISGYMSGLSSKNSAMLARMFDYSTKAISRFRNNAGLVALHSAGGNTLQGYINGLTTKTSSLYSKMRSIASSAISAFQEKLGIHSPSTVFDSFGGNTLQGYIQGNERMVPALVQKMKGIAEKAAESFSSGMNLETIDYDLSVLAAAPTVAFAGSYGGGSGSGSDMQLLQEQLQKLDNLYALMKVYLPQLANMKVMLDKRTVVGELTPDISEKMREEERRLERGG